jgi:cytochrome c-type biogenesis protein CcmH/NrfG
VLAPGFSELGYQLGRLLIERGERARGQRLIDEDRRARAEAAEFNRLVIVAGTDPKNPEHHRHLARWCMKHGRLARAILEWQEVLDRLPHDAEARQGLQAARARRGDPAA